jgi:hypothetical protein
MRAPTSRVARNPHGYRRSTSLDTDRWWCRSSSTSWGHWFEPSGADRMNAGIRGLREGAPRVVPGAVWLRSGCPTGWRHQSGSYHPSMETTAPITSERDLPLPVRVEPRALADDLIEGRLSSADTTASSTSC